MLECYAYYLPGAARVADRGTLLRFVERSAPRAALPLPGLAAVAAAYDGSGAAAYADHWVRQKKAGGVGPAKRDISWPWASTRTSHACTALLGLVSLVRPTAEHAGVVGWNRSQMWWTAAAFWRLWKTASASRPRFDACDVRLGERLLGFRSSYFHTFMGVRGCMAVQCKPRSTFNAGVVHSYAEDPKQRQSTCV